MAGIAQKPRKPARDTASDESPEAGPSQIQGDSESSEHSGSEEENDEGDRTSSPPDDLPEGMDPEGFVGEKILKPLTPKALAAFQAAQNRAGVIYISRIPPGMRPTKIRHLMSAYGDIGRVYLQQEGMLYTITRMRLIILKMQSALICVGNIHLPKSHIIQKVGSNSKTRRWLVQLLRCSMLSLSEGRRVHDGEMIFGR